MKTLRHEHDLSRDGSDVSGKSSSASTSHTRLAAPVRNAIGRTRDWLLENQQPSGHWVAELEGDTILESEYILLLAFLGREREPVARKAAEYVVRQQLDGGGWTTFPGGDVDISVSVKAYFALKLTGHDPSQPYMQQARAAIMAHGGADAVNSFTRFYLALLGQISYDECPAVPPEILLAPSWFPLNIYRISAWSRTILVPLSIMRAIRPVKRIDPALGIRELFLRHPKNWPAPVCPGQKRGRGPFSWRGFFLTADRVMRWLERRGIVPLRRLAISAARRWMLARFEGSDGLGAIFPPVIWTVVALKCLDYDDDSPEIQYNLRQLDALMIDEDDAVRLQPCKSPVWDTAISLRALAESGAGPQDGRVRNAVDWILDREITTPGDWNKTVKAAPGGWCFEYANRFYPDIDDTVMVLAALDEQFSASRGLDDPLPPDHKVLKDAVTGRIDDARRSADTLDRVAAATDRAVRWTLAMQNGDGGWGAFDRNNNVELLCRVPFADHNAMIDPSTPDLTGRVIETLGRLGHKVGHPAVDRAVAYLRRTQEPDGSWFGRWGVNYIYGTWQVLVGLADAGVPTDDPAVVAGANWLLAHQQPDGGWGESPASYADPATRGQGPTTASQTAWAVMGLVAAGMARSDAAAAGVRWLVDRQRDDGKWDEPQFTGTGFPQVFYLRYHLYPVYFPLMALARWAKAAEV